MQWVYFLKVDCYIINFYNLFEDDVELYKFANVKENQKNIQRNEFLSFLVETSNEFILDEKTFHFGTGEKIISGQSIYNDENSQLIINIGDEILINEEKEKILIIKARDIKNRKQPFILLYRSLMSPIDFLINNLIYLDFRTPCFNA